MRIAQMRRDLPRPDDALRILRGGELGETDVEGSQIVKRLRIGEQRGCPCV
jgi:hypothetical protein